MAVQLKVQTTKSVELRDIPFRDWPEECKDAARYILSSPVQLKAFHQELFKQEWLVCKVEKYLQTSEEFAAEFSIFAAARR